MEGRQLTRKRSRVGDVELANLPPVAPLVNGSAPPVAPPQTPAEERRERELDDILEEIGSESRIKVWHIADGKAQYAGELNGDGFSLEVLLDVFGGGDKTLKVYQGMKLVDTVRVSLDATVPAKSPRSAAASKTTAPAPGNDNSMMAIMGTMMAQQAQAMTAIMSGVAAMMGSANNKPDGLADIVKALASRPEPDPLAMVTKVLELTKREPTPTSSATELFNIFEKGMKLGQGVAGKDEGDGMGAMMTEGVKALGNLIEGIVIKQKAEAARMNAGLPALPSQAPVDAPIVTTGTPPGESADVAVIPGQPAWVAAARPHIGTLVAAAKFISPDSAADTIDQNLTDAEFESLIMDIENQEGGGFGTRLVQYFPQVAQVDPNWIGALVTALIQTDEGDVATQPGGAV
jgi:hypothetical protein